MANRVHLRAESTDIRDVIHCPAVLLRINTRRRGLRIAKARLDGSIVDHRSDTMTDRSTREVSCRGQSWPVRCPRRGHPPRLRRGSSRGFGSAGHLSPVLTGGLAAAAAMTRARC